MTTHLSVRSSLGSALALAAALTAGSITLAQSPAPPLAIDTARITIAGTSNVHAYTASTTDARVTRVKFGSGTTGAAFWDEAQKPGGLEAFDISIAAGSLTSTKEGIDKNMHEALKVKEHPEITFILKRMEGAPGALNAFGTLRIAGMERAVTLPLKTTRNGASLAVTGELNMLMTDFGIAPPKAMLGMVKADPKVKVTFEVLLAIPTT
jgi:polyisoprenoid-binding protein YceI